MTEKNHSLGKERKVNASSLRIVDLRLYFDKTKWIVLALLNRHFGAVNQMGPEPDRTGCPHTLCNCPNEPE